MALKLKNYNKERWIRWSGSSTDCREGRGAAGECGWVGYGGWVIYHDLIACVCVGGGGGLRG